MVADDAVSAYARDGVVVIRGLVKSIEIEAIAAGIEKVLSNRSQASVANDSGDDDGPVEDYCRWSEIDEIGRVALRSGVPKAAAELMDSPSARFFHDHVLVDRPRDEGETRWRQELPFFNVQGRGITAWISVDPVPKQGSPEFWAGSHLGPWRLPAKDVEEHSKRLPEGALTLIPDLDEDRSRYDIRRWELDPGDVIFYDFATVHTAPGFASDGDRRVLSLRYLSADARHAQRPWPTTPAFPGLDRELADGAEFDHAYFPMAWPR